MITTALLKSIKIQKMGTNLVKTLLPYTICLGLCWRYISYVYQHTANGPFCDDILTILYPINSLVDSGLESYIHELVSLHNEHKVLTLKLISGLYFWVFSEVNFKWLCLIGDFIFCFIPLLIMRCEKNVWIIAVSLFFLTPRVNGSALWAMTALSNFMVVFLALLALRVMELSPRMRSLVGGLLIFLCVMSQGNGLIYGLLILGYSINRNGIKASLPLLFVFFVATLAYFYKWHPNQDPLRLSFSYSKNIDQLIMFFLAILGSVSPNLGWARVFGLLMLIFYLGIKINKFDRDRYSLSDVVILGSIISAGMITPNRVFLGPESAIVSRYAILSISLLGGLLSKIIQVFPQLTKVLLPPIMGMALSFYLWAWRTLDQQELMPFYVGQALAMDKSNNVKIDIGCGVDTKILEDIVNKSLALSVYKRN